MVSDLARFQRNFLDPETPFTYIGPGELGGKAHGLVTMGDVLRKEIPSETFQGITVEIPSLTVLRTEVFDTFLASNRLYDLAFSDLSFDQIAYAFQKADLPFDVLGDLWALVEQVQTPLAVRSSSLLEDARHKPFAGIYATKMIPNNSYEPKLRFRQLADAIKFVYASTFSRQAKNYRKATGHKEEEEKMAVIIQELVGKRHHTRFYPELSGVGRSYNYYPMKPATPDDGVVSLALGLGKTIVDGEPCWTYSPAYPKIGPPYGSVDNLLKESQTRFWLVNMGEPPEYNPMKETEYLLKGDLSTAERDEALRYLASTYSPLSGRLSIGTGFKGPRALTFAPLLTLEEIPLNALISELFRISETTLNTPVEIEFAMTFDPHRFCFLQVRSMEAPEGESRLEVEQLSGGNILVASDNALGNGTIDTLQDIVYTKPENFSLTHTKTMARELEAINRQLLEAGRPYLLVALGRLGTTDPWLGIPINWGDISGAKVIVEVAQENARVELSQGSHYFHNIISLGIKYFSQAFNSSYQIDWEWLNQRESVAETQFICHVTLPRPLQVIVDGRNSRGVIYKA